MPLGFAGCVVNSILELWRGGKLVSHTRMEKVWQLQSLQVNCYSS